MKPQLIPKLLTVCIALASPLPRTHAADASVSTATATATTTAAAVAASGPIVQENVIYGQAAGVDLKFDLIQPSTGEGPFPAVVYFHGGGWQGGNKHDGRGWIKGLAAQGYVGVSVGYRFVPQYPWPAQVEDAKAAVRYLRAHAKELNVDPNRIGAMGDSAGAYLALMLGVTGPEDQLEGTGGNPDFSSRVQAVVSYYSPTNFTLFKKPEPNPQIDAINLAYYHKTTAQVVADMLPTKDPADPILTRMSVMPHVDKSDPPTLLFQGDADPFVSLDHVQQLDRAMTAAGVTHELVIVHGGGHGWTGKLQEESNRKTAEFLAKYLKAKQ